MTQHFLGVGTHSNHGKYLIAYHIYHILHLHCQMVSKCRVTQSWHPSQIFCIPLVFSFSLLAPLPCEFDFVLHDLNTLVCYLPLLYCILYVTLQNVNCFQGCNQSSQIIISQIKRLSSDNKWASSCDFHVSCSALTSATENHVKVLATDQHQHADDLHIEISEAFIEIVLSADFSNYYPEKWIEYNRIQKNRKPKCRY